MPHPLALLRRVPPAAAETPPRVIIIGGGFGGLAAARSLRRFPGQVTLIDRRNFHLFQPLLYQVATGDLSPANIASPLRHILRRQRNTTVVLAEVTAVDLPNRSVVAGGRTLPFDWLIVAAGAQHSYFGRDEWAELAPGLKTIEDATEIRQRIFHAFEMAEQCENPEHRKSWLTFAIVGGGPTGVELAGALSEIAHDTLKHDFRHIDPATAQIVLVEAGPRPLAMYSPRLTARATEALQRLHVTLLTGHRVVGIREGLLTVETAEGRRALPARTVIWAAGIAASPLGRPLADASGSHVDRAGCVAVQPDLSLPGYPQTFVIGDLARVHDTHGQPLPALAPVAMQQGRFVARTIRRRTAGRKPPERFHYRDRGSMAVIGRYRAIARTRRFEFSGWFAWLLWLVIHLREITQFRNRVIVLMQWAWAFFTHDRSARLITGDVTVDLTRCHAAEIPSPTDASAESPSPVPPPR